MMRETASQLYANKLGRTILVSIRISIRSRPIWISLMNVDPDLHPHAPPLRAPSAALIPPGPHPVARELRPNRSIDR